MTAAESGDSDDLASLEQAVEEHPASLAARLKLARAYHRAGRFAEARILFDPVLRFDNLPSGLSSQSEIYARAADHYLEAEDAEASRLVGFEFVELGLGGYRVNSTSDVGGAEPSELFYLAKLSGALSYMFSSGYALDGAIDYEGRLYDSNTTRNDSELDARVGVSRSLGASELELALRGTLTYIGDGDYRHDYGASLDWHYALNAQNEISAGTFVRRRQYPSGPRRDRSRTIAEASTAWTHSFADGATSVRFGVHGGYQYATRRPDGDSGFYGATADLDHAFSERLSAYVSGFWERNRFNTDHIHFHPDSLDDAGILRRRDNLYEVAIGLVWEFARGWGLEPGIFYVHDNSNLDDFHYASTEFWAGVRKSF